MTLEKQKQKPEATEAYEELMDVISEWISLDRQTAKDDDWLRYARQPRRR